MPYVLLSLLAAVLTLGVARAEENTAAPPATSAKDLSKGGTVLLIGDSIFDCHEGEKRLEAVLKGALEKQAPGAAWTVWNEARGGELIGPVEGEARNKLNLLFTDEKSGHYVQILKKRPKADVVVVNYSANDSKVYGPEDYRTKLDGLVARLRQDYPGCLVALSTGMYQDPKHSDRYWINPSMVPGFKNGSLRNEYLAPYQAAIRACAAEHGCLLADVHRAMKDETEMGNWDFRVRGDGSGDPKDDPKHEGDMAWFTNIHPNDRGTALIAETIAKTLTAKR
ncbi:MAG: hypothetical protein KIS92_18365 [Planctomycetota bacterium]|nr:hypothetical protein [Planctomycetota bacterium]